MKPNLYTKKEECAGCSGCFAICPQGAIEMTTDKEGFKFPKVNDQKCIECGLCETVCPMKQTNDCMTNTNVGMIAHTKKEDIREKSSSGGIMYEIAAHEIKNHGTVIFGAALNENQKLEHKKVDNIDTLEELLGSKYVQSDIGATFNKVKDELNKNKRVIFIGTPCQVSGLYYYLKKSRVDTVNLYLIDFVCHGVPSPKVWEDYLTEKREEYSSEIIKVNFRDKKQCWRDYGMSIAFKNGKEYYKSHYLDLYMFYYLQDYSIRSSCTCCNLNGLDVRKSDITLADAWLEEGKHGESFITINSEKGQELFEGIRNCVIYRENDVHKYIKKIDNRKYDISKRNQFYKDYLESRSCTERKYFRGKAKYKNICKHYIYKIKGR